MDRFEREEERERERLRRLLRRREWLRFADAKRQEMSRYHSVSHSGEPLADCRLDYKPPDLPEPYEPATFADTRLQLARFIPQDGRIKLAFDLDWQLKKVRHEVVQQTPLVGYPNEVFQDRLLNQMILPLNRFGEKIQTFGNFFVWDTHCSEPKIVHVVYDLGCHDLHATIFAAQPNKVVERFTDGDELFQWFDGHKISSPAPRSENDGVAPWQRIIACQGLPLTLPEGGGKRFFPFLVFDDDNDPIKLATDLHLSCERRGGSEMTNPYSDPYNAFHITFYEKLPGPNLFGLIKQSRDGKLKIGHLYGKLRENSTRTNREDDELAFRQSSFTVLATTGHNTHDQKPSSRSYWTMLLLSPSGFFPGLPGPDEPETNPNMFWQNLGSRASQKAVELSVIVHALRKVEERWRWLNQHIGSLLVEDFMDPKAYTKLLFDDETFSRSRLYFWVIGCLNEFVVSIEDNIKQWNLFRQARNYHSLKPPPEVSPKSHEPSPEEVLRAELWKLDKEAGEIRQSLEDVQAQFRTKLATVQALRDGLFNASALMESRSSTRLGQNVQLLTYVSIFYLPLAFCAALWAVPNITDDNTMKPFIITTFLVWLATHVCVFNLGNIAEALGRKYLQSRKQLLEMMEKDSDTLWRDRRELFEEFPPNNDRKTPSEWWIIRYWIECQMHKLRRTLGGDIRDEES